MGAVPIEMGEYAASMTTVSSSAFKESGIVCAVELNCNKKKISIDEVKTNFKNLRRVLYIMNDFPF